MTLVFSYSYDRSTTDVLNWLKYYDHKFIRLNYDIKEDVIDIVGGDGKNGLKNILLNIAGNEMKLGDIKFLWYRHGGHRLNNFIKESVSLTNRTIREEIKYYLTAHSQARIEYLEFLFYHIPTLGKHNGSRINKLKVLELATKTGLKVPNYIITTTKKQVLEFMDNHKSVINKSLDIPFSCMFSETENLMSYTTIVTKDMINDLPEKFGLSLIQEEISKDYEIRSFFIGNRFFSTAIHSQKNPKTEVDYRRYDKNYMNRITIYALPKYVQSKLMSLMEILGLKTGSVDLIRNQKGEYIFLEVNPAGQFGYLSRMCNYNIEREIAQYIIKCSHGS